MNQICFNGKIVKEEEPVLLASNRGYRYGDGLFETMKVTTGKIQFASFHFERLFKGMTMLDFMIPKLLTPQKIEQEILHLCEVNKCQNLARIRCSVFRGNGGLYDDDKMAQYIIECWPLNESINKLNENGLVIDIYPEAKKSCDKFSALKSANFLPYTAAANYAKQNKLNDCIVLNTSGTIADTTIANIFIVKDGVVFTPRLDQGCIHGVMRRHLVSAMQEAGEEIREAVLTVDDVLDADEVFLSNAINGIRWVRQCGNSLYGNVKAIGIYNRFIQTIN